MEPNIICCWHDDNTTREERFPAKRNVLNFFGNLGTKHYCINIPSQHAQASNPEHILGLKVLAHPLTCQTLLQASWHSQQRRTIQASWHSQQRRTMETFSVTVWHVPFHGYITDGYGWIGRTQDSPCEG
jgi:hypothetical protein